MSESPHSNNPDVVRSLLAQARGWAEDNRVWLTFLIWLGIATYFLQVRSDNIYWFTLSDTDDNMRYLQVRDWLAGQGWFDLHQYRMAPPEGADIHWSRLIDLPLAGLMLLFGLVMEQGNADRWACAIAPLLPLLLLVLSLALITRRLTRDGSSAWIFAIILPLAAPVGLVMFMPMRIDHHGWQLALAVTMLAGIVDRKWLRGGIIAGLASALSVAIGMEMIIYLAGAGGLIALRWVFKPGAARRMLPYALALGGGTGLLYTGFASTANRALVCDALSPIWVATLGMAAGGMVLLVLLPLKSWQHRLIAGGTVGSIIGALAFLLWPQCFTSAYHISPELEQLWLANIREAKSILVLPAAKAIPMLALPIAGVLSSCIGSYHVRKDTERLWAWGTVTLMMLFALMLMFWQIRATPAAQLLAIPAVAWAIYASLERMISTRASQRIIAAISISGLIISIWASDLYPAIQRWLPQTSHNIAASKPTDTSSSASPSRAAYMQRVRQANAQCRTLSSLRPLNQIPPATLFTLVDLGPRIIATTHHSVIAGPYHRNGAAILDIHHAFDGTAETFRSIARRRGASYFLLCPDFPEGTIYRTRSPHGFYAQMEKGDVPEWLVPVQLKAEQELPYTLYRIKFQERAEY